MKIEDIKRQLPSAISELIGDNTWQKVTKGESDAAVYRIQGETVRYLKISAIDSRYPIKTEKLKLAWLQDKIVAPQVIAYAELPTHQYLLMSEISGTYPFHDDLDWTIEERLICLAQAARDFHRLPVATCPFKWGIEQQMARVRRNIGLNYINLAKWGHKHNGITIEERYQELIALTPTDEDKVVVHGDMYPVNIHANPQTKQVTGYLDVGACGIGDRFTDLALIAQAIGWHFGTDYVPFFFEAYGLPIDEQKLRFYQMMVEFL